MSRALPPEVVDDVVVPLPVGEVAIEGFLDGRIDPERAPDRGDANVVPIKLGDHLRRSQVANADTGERRIDKVRNEPAMGVVREDGNVRRNDVVRTRLGAQPVCRDMNPGRLGLQPDELPVLLVCADDGEDGGEEQERD